MSAFAGYNPIGQRSQPGIADRPVGRLPGPDMFDRLLVRDTTPRYVDLMSNAQSQGYRPSGEPGMVQRGIGGISGNVANPRAVELRPIESLPGAQQGQPGSFLEQLLQAVLYDTRSQQEAADRQYGRNEAQIGVVNDTIMQGADAYRSTVAGEADSLRQTASQYRKQFEQGAEDVLTNYKDRTDLEISAATAGIERRFKNQMQQVNAGLRPDGSKMTMQEQQAAKMELQDAANNEIASTAVTMASRFNETFAQLGVALSGQRLQSQSIAGDLEKTAAAMRDASSLAAFQMEVNGQLAMAELIRANPESLVSLTNALLTVGSFATAPGAANLPALRAPERTIRGNRRA